jgi:glutathionyl-hydroquinone reductase
MQNLGCDRWRSGPAAWREYLTRSSCCGMHPRRMQRLGSAHSPLGRWPWCTHGRRRMVAALACPSARRRAVRRSGRRLGLPEDVTVRVSVIRALHDARVWEHRVQEVRRRERVPCSSRQVRKWSRSRAVYAGTGNPRPERGTAAGPSRSHRRLAEVDTPPHETCAGRRPKPAA